MFKRINKSLRLKLILLSMGIEILMLALLLGNSLRIINNTMHEQTELRIEAAEPLLNAAIGIPLIERNYAALINILDALYSNKKHNFNYIVVLDDQENIYAKVGVEENLSADTYMKDGSDIVNRSTPVMLEDELIGYIYYGLSLRSFIESKEDLLKQGLIIAVLELLLSLVLLITAGYFLTKNLDVLLKGISFVTNEEYDKDIKVSSPDEFGELADGFNVMTKAIRERVNVLNQTRDALERSRAEFESIFNSMADGVIYLDTDRICLMASPSTAKMFGYPVEYFENKRVDFLYYDIEVYNYESKKRFKEDSLDFSDGFEAQYVRKDGSIFTGELIASKVMDGHGKHVGFIGILRDISERKVAEIALRDEKERAMVTLKSIGDAVITTDKGGIIEYLNPVAEEITGWTSQEAKGLNLSEVFIIHNELDNKPVETPVEECLRKNKIIEMSNHIVLTNRFGKKFAIEDSAAPIRDKENNILGVILVFHDVSRARKMTKELSWQATHDSLTGLVNRQEFETVITKLLNKSKEDSNLHHALLYMDLDQFKIINDTCGHMAGDELLRQLTSVLKAEIRTHDTLARLGGDEFGVLLENCSRENAVIIAEKLRKAVESYRYAWADKSFLVAITIGLVPITSSKESIGSLMSAADIACITAKDSGRNRVYIYEIDDAEVIKRHGEMQWVSEINKALEENSFVLYAQPIADISTAKNKIYHHEILIRLKNDNNEIISPMAFLPAAERYSLMTDIDKWVIANVFKQLKTSPLEEGHVLSINLSGTSIGEKNFTDFIKNEFDKSSVKPDSICFEITETAAISNLSFASSFIADLSSIGCKFSLDDFGSGLSSFGYLKNLRVDYLKVDGFFVKDMHEDPINHAMVDAINNIGHVMGIKTIAEYVENKEILKQLKDMRVDFAQGYHISKPFPFSKLKDV